MLENLTETYGEGAILMALGTIWVGAMVTQRVLHHRSLVIA